MHRDTLKATDDYSANKSTHPRVSLADMQLKIVAAYCFTAAEALHNRPEAIPDHEVVIAPALSVLTMCLIVMQNGFTIIGKSAPVSPENFDREKCERLAYEDAIKQLWPLEGYALRERLATT